MSALAKYLLICGYEVSGSDMSAGEQTEKLLSCGVKVLIGGTDDPNLLAADAVVYTSAISDEHPQLVAARKAGKQIWERSEFLGLLCKGFSSVAAIAGSHGKTTCTAMCAHVLQETGVPFAAHIGGEDSEFGNFFMTGRDYFVTEACEYKKNLLKIQADTAVLLNIDRDHMECYDGIDDLENTFKRYCQKAKTAFVCADDKRCSKWGDFSTFGIDDPLADYRALDIRQAGEKYSFTVSEYGNQLCRVKLKAAGRCNVYNALAAFAVMRSYGFNEREISRGLGNFTAVKRRFETVGTFWGATCICDYAHHPREIAATVATAEKLCRGNLYVVFQPHTYSRTKLLMGEFVGVLRDIKHLMIYKTYPAREYFDEEGSGYTLAKNVGSLYAESVRELKAWLKNTVRENDTVLFLGAGDIYYVAKYLLKEMK
jgi:UDP-N-acetylmuramate--alanine ligase